MSWYVSVPVTPAAEFEAAIDALELPVFEHATSDSYGPEAQAQFAAAKAAVKALYRSGSLGSGDYYAGSMGGHANPGHTPREGWSNDTINVSVYQAQSPTS